MDGMLVSPMRTTPTRKSPRSSTRRKTVDNGTEALNALLDDSVGGSTAEMSMSMSVASLDERRNTADPDALAAIMATFDAEEVDKTCESLTQSVSAAAPEVITSAAKARSSSRRSSRSHSRSPVRSPMRNTDRRQTADAADMAALLGDLEDEESALEATGSIDVTAALVATNDAPANDRRMTADASDMMALMGELEKENATADLDHASEANVPVFTGRESIESVCTMDLVKQVGHLLGEEDAHTDDTTGRVSMLSMEDGDMGTLGTLEMDMLLDQAHTGHGGRESFDTVDTADLMREVQAVCNDQEEEKPVEAVAPKDTTSSPGFLATIMNSSAAVVTEEAKVKEDTKKTSSRSSKGDSSKQATDKPITPMRQSRRLSGVAPPKPPTPEPSPELSPITMTLSVYKEPLDMASVRGILSSKKAPKSGRKSVVFGSPKACEFKKEELVTSYTPMHAEDVSAFFSMEPAPTMQDERDEEEGNTRDNSSILDEWDRLSHAGSEDGGSPMTTGSPVTPMSTASARSSPRRRSMLQPNLEDDEPTGTVELPATLNDLLDDAAVNVPLQFVAVHEPVDDENTCDLEMDLGDMMKQLGASEEEVPEKEEEEDGPTVQLEPCLADLMTGVQGEEAPINFPVAMAADADNHTCELEPNLGAVLDLANTEMTRDEDGVFEDMGDSVRKSGMSEYSFASSVDTAPLSVRSRMSRGSINSSRGSLGAAILSPSATPASLLNRLQGLNAAARRTTLSHCDDPLAATSRMSIGMKRHSMMTSASRIQSTAKKAKGVALRLSLQGAPIATSLGLNDSVAFDDADAAEPARESENLFDGDESTAELSVAEAAAVLSSPSQSEIVVEAENHELETDDATSVELRDLLELVGLMNAGGRVTTPNMHDTMASATNRCSDKMAAMIKSSVEELLVDAVEQFPVQEANEGALEDVWNEVEASVYERAEQALASGKEAEHLKQSGRLCHAAAAAKWGEWEAHIIENGTKALEEQLENIKAEREALAADLQEKETFLAPYTALSSSGMSADNHLGNLRTSLREARTNLEESRATLLTLGDETSDLLETRKNALLNDVTSVVPQSVELALAELDSPADSHVAALENEVEQLASTVGVMGGVTWTRVISILSDTVETEHLLADGVALQFTFALREHNERVAVSLANVDLSIEDKVCESTAALANWFFQDVLSKNNGPLAPDAVAAVATLTDVQTLLKNMCGHVSSLRHTMIWLQAFSVDGWKWTVQQPKEGDSEALVIVHTPRNSCRLCLPLEIIMTGNISGLSSSSLRNKKGEVILQRDMASVIKLLSARTGSPFGCFPSGPLRREVVKIMNATEM